MSDNKWDRFKRAFGAQPSDKLVEVRDGKITEELDKLTPQISRLTLAGLDAGEIGVRRASIGNRRTEALNLKTNKEKCDALDPIKDDARKLAADAPGIVDGRLQHLTEEINRLTGILRPLLGKASSLPHDACKAAFKTIADPIQVEFDDALAPHHTDEDRRKALADIDPAPLRKAVADIAIIGLGFKHLSGAVDTAQRQLDELPDGKQKDDFGRELTALITKRDLLANETALDKLDTGVKSLKIEVKDVTDRLGDVHRDYTAAVKGIEALMKVINLAVDKAKGLRSEVCKSVVAGPLLTVETAVSDAAKLPTKMAEHAALKLIDLRPLTMAIASAADIDNGVSALLAALAKMVPKVTDKKKQGTFETERDRLQKLADGLVAETDLESARRGYAAILGPAEKLMDNVIKARGKDGYTEALKERYGVDIENKPGAKPNIQSAYEMMEMVPASHVGHDKLTKLVFTGSSEGGGAYGSGAIDMDNFGVLDNLGYGYEVEGKSVRPNGFNVCMLHEIGHSVDDKYGIMDKLMGQTGYGDWRIETRDSVTKVLVDAMMGELGAVGDPLTGEAKAAITKALTGDAPDKPASASREQWKIIRKYADIGVAITVKKDPWFNAKPSTVAIDGRVYMQSYDSEWHSYALSERAGQNVRDYQWRAPGEWFADLYGVLWMTNKPPPAGVGSALARWFPT